MPLEICKLSRSKRSTICTEQQGCFTDKGYCASQKTIYYGYKLHAICTNMDIFHRLDISPASEHDIHYLKDVKQ